MSSHRANKQRARGPSAKKSASLTGSAGATAAEIERLRQSEVDNKAKIRSVSLHCLLGKDHQALIFGKGFPELKGQIK